MLSTGSFGGCICQLGWIGTYCEVSSSTGTGTGTGTGTCNCLNGGICQANANNVATCTCKGGFTGSRCETQFFTCPRNGRFKHPYECVNGKYIECVYYGTSQYPTGILFVRDCPPNQRYNPNADFCDFPENVTC